MAGTTRTFRLGADKVLRLPSAAEYAEAVDKEHRWLPALAYQLPLPVPVPLAKGEPSADYPHPWSIYAWLDGVTARPERVADPVGLALDLADFLAALQRVDVADGPQPGVHNWFRGGTLRTYDARTRSALRGARWPRRRRVGARGLDEALDARWDGVDRWFHGDMAEGNLLLVDGRLSAVIDFGTCGVGDPACDLAVAWTLLDSEATSRRSGTGCRWTRTPGHANGAGRSGRRSPPAPRRTTTPSARRSSQARQRVLGEVLAG